MNTAYDWTKFQKQIFIKASPEEVLYGWTKPVEIVRWFIGQAEYTTSEGTPRASNETVQAGDQYYWRWLQNADLRGEILAVEPGKMIQFTFGENGAGLDKEMVVTVKVSEIDDGTTLLELDQDNIADSPDAHADYHLGCHLGWEFYLTNLKAFLEHGVDLREHTEERAKISRS